MSQLYLGNMGDEEEHPETPIPFKLIKKLRNFISNTIHKGNSISKSELLDKINEFKSIHTGIDNENEESDDSENDTDTEYEDSDDESEKDEEKEEDVLSEDSLRYIRNILKAAIHGEFSLTYEAIYVIINN